MPGGTQVVIAGVPATFELVLNKRQSQHAWLSDLDKHTKKFFGEWKSINVNSEVGECE